jgi:hypothetical protein
MHSNDFSASSIRPGSRNRRGMARAALCLAALLSVWLSAPIHAQVVPFANVVPLDELETPTDDLIRLSTSYADAVRELKTARLTIDTLQTLRPSTLITSLEVQIAQVNVEAAEAKVRLLSAIAQKQLSAAEAKLDLLKRLEAMQKQNGNEATGLGENRLRIAQAEATIAILKMILAVK